MEPENDYIRLKGCWQAKFWRQTSWSAAAKPETKGLEKTRCRTNGRLMAPSADARNWRWRFVGLQSRKSRNETWREAPLDVWKHHQHWPPSNHWDMHFHMLVYFCNFSPADWRPWCAMLWRLSLSRTGTASPLCEILQLYWKAEKWPSGRVKISAKWFLEKSIVNCKSWKQSTAW